MWLGILAPDPRSRVMAYFYICWSKYKILFMHGLKRNALHVCILKLVRLELEMHLIYGDSNLKAIKL